MIPSRHRVRSEPPPARRNSPSSRHLAISIEGDSVANLARGLHEASLRIESGGAMGERC